MTKLGSLSCATHCIDGTHITILAPKRSERIKYFNRKGSYSLNAALICTWSNMRKIYVYNLWFRYVIISFIPHMYHLTIEDLLMTHWYASELKLFLETNYNNGDKNTSILAELKVMKEISLQRRITYYSTKGRRLSVRGILITSERRGTPDLIT